MVVAGTTTSKKLVEETYTLWDGASPSAALPAW